MGLSAVTRGFSTRGPVMRIRILSGIGWIARRRSYTTRERVMFGSESIWPGILGVAIALYFLCLIEIWLNPTVRSWPRSVKIYESWNSLWLLTLAVLLVSPCFF